MQETGLHRRGGHESTFDSGGGYVLNIAEYPIKCPVAPIEFICLADYFFHLKGIRHKVDLEVVTSAQRIFSKPVAGPLGLAEPPISSGRVRKPVLC